MKTCPPLGAADPASVFQRFREIGDRELATVRAVSASPLEQKSPRRWQRAEVAQLLGVPERRLRKNQAQFELDEINAERDRLGLRYQRPAGSRPMVMPIVNFKGGVAKTTTGIHLAQYLAIQGLRVLVVDLDPQASMTLNLSNIIPDLELEESDIANEALLKDPASLRYLIRETYFTNVFIVPTNLALQDLDLSLMHPDLNNEATLGIPAASRLAVGLEALGQDFDVILIDCPPNMGPLTTNAIIAATGLLIPLPPQQFDRASFVMFCHSLEALFGALQKPLAYLRVLISKHPNSKAARLQEQLIREMYGDYVLKNAMYMTTEVEKATALLSSIYDQERAMDRRETYERAISLTNAVNQEILDDFKTIWEAQAHGQE